MLNTGRPLFSLIVLGLGEDLPLAAVTLFQRVAHYLNGGVVFALQVSVVVFGKESVKEMDSKRYGLALTLTLP